jgi:sensor histidine kinase regulating citrate/malate metabolism
LPHAESQVKITISNSGEILEVNNNQPVSEKLLSQKQEKKRFGCIGISFQLIQELLQKNNSKIWIEENPNDGVSFHLLLPTLE